MKKINLYCLAFAGGNKYSYREFADKAPSFLNIIPLEYPGRGARVKEPLLSNIVALVDDLYSQVKANGDQKEYAIYGHSMGGLTGYLLAKKLVENGHRAPLHLFITGTSGPSAISRTEKKRYLLETSEFIQEIKDLDGMPDEILSNEELLQYFEPILRSDFKASETYLHEGTDPVNIPITVITGTEEDMELEEIYLWQKESSYKVDFKQLPGKHFFIFQHIYQIFEIITQKIYSHKIPLTL